MNELMLLLLFIGGAIVGAIFYEIATNTKTESETAEMIRRAKKLRRRSG